MCVRVNKSFFYYALKIKNVKKKPLDARVFLKVIKLFYYTNKIWKDFLAPFN